MTMFRKLILYSLVYILAVEPVLAGLISHTDYSSGATITAAGQNTNENAVFNEFNGNIDSTNIKANGVAYSNLATVLQGTFTFVNAMGAYRRPVIQWISSTAIDVENNTGTQYQTCINFPDGQRCVTENTGVTTQYRRFVVTSTASFVSGTEASGMVGQVPVNKWIAIYAVKSQINASNFVLAGSTNTVTQANFATLNTLFNTNGWVFLGLSRYGDAGSLPTGIVKFSQVGHITTFNNSNTAGSAVNTNGIQFLTSAGATTLTYVYAAGTGSLQIPDNVTLVKWGCYWGGSASSSGNTVQGLGGNIVAKEIETVNATSGIQIQNVASEGLIITAGASQAMDGYLQGFVDNALGVGSNPQL